MSRRGERGYVLAALLVAITIMLLGLTAAAPTWRYIMKDAREEELIFRGTQIADAIARYQQRHGNALPTSLELLVEGKFLRKLYTDPMTKDGKWRLIRLGEPIPGATPPGAPASGPGLPGSPPTPAPSPTPGPGTRPGTSGTSIGGIQGVASRSTEESLRSFNGKTRYDEWLFVVGQPRVVGETPIDLLGPGAVVAPPQIGPPQQGQPGAQPTPGTRPRQP